MEYKQAKELIKAITDVNDTITDNDMQAEVVRELQAIRQALQGINKSLQIMGDFYDDLKTRQSLGSMRDYL